MSSLSNTPLLWGKHIFSLLFFLPFVRRGHYSAISLQKLLNLVLPKIRQTRLGPSIAHLASARCPLAPRF